MANRTDSILRAFGMSGFQVLDDLEAVEETHNVELGTTSKAKASRALEGYDQFSQQLRTQAKTMSEVPLD